MNIFFSRSLSCLFCIVLLSACSANWKHPLHTATPAVVTGRPGSIVVIVKDNRVYPQSVSPERAKNFVGEIEPMFSQPIPVLNASDNSVAQDIATALCKAFSEQRWRCIPKESKFSGTVQEEMPYIVQDDKVDRFLYVVISDFAAIVQTSGSLNYDFDVTIWNGVGRFLSSVGQHGTYPFQAAGVNPAETASRVTPKALEEILTNILNAKPARQALRL